MRGVAARVVCVDAAPMCREVKAAAIGEDKRSNARTFAFAPSKLIAATPFAVQMDVTVSASPSAPRRVSRSLAGNSLIPTLMTEPLDGLLQANSRLERLGT